MPNTARYSMFPLEQRASNNMLMFCTHVLFFLAAPSQIHANPGHPERQQRVWQHSTRCVEFSQKFPFNEYRWWKRNEVRPKKKKRKKMHRWACRALFWKLIMRAGLSSVLLIPFWGRSAWYSWEENAAFFFAVSIWSIVAAPCFGLC